MLLCYFAFLLFIRFEIFTVVKQKTAKKKKRSTEKKIYLNSESEEKQQNGTSQKESFRFVKEICKLKDQYIWSLEVSDIEGIIVDKSGFTRWGKYLAIPNITSVDKSNSDLFETQVSTLKKNIEILLDRFPNLEVSRILQELSIKSFNQFSDSIGKLNLEEPPWKLVQQEISSLKNQLSDHRDYKIQPPFFFASCEFFHRYSTQQQNPLPDTKNNLEEFISEQTKTCNGASRNSLEELFHKEK